MEKLIESVEKGLESKHPAVSKLTNTVIETLNTALLPFSLVNAGIKRANQYFQENFNDEYAEKTIKIPAEYQQEPKANIVRQAIIGIADTIDQPTLKEAFLNTLAKSADNRNDDSLYPAYLNIIQQLGCEGLACFVNFVTKYKKINPHYPPIYFADKGYIDFALSAVEQDLLPIPKRAMLENWQRLGLITLSPKLETASPVIKDGEFVMGAETLKKLSKPPQANQNLLEIRLTEFASEFFTTVSD